MNARRKSSSIAFRALTPMLDTLFLLLFALLAVSDARELEETEDVRIQLPEVESGPDESAIAGEVFSIVIDADSVVRLGGDESVVGSLEELDRALAAQLRDALPEEVVIEIVADRDARHGVMVEVLQHLRLAGFVEVRLLATGGSSHSSFGGGPR